MDMEKDKNADKKLSVKWGIYNLIDLVIDPYKSLTITGDVKDINSFLLYSDSVSFIKKDITKLDKFNGKISSEEYPSYFVKFNDKIIELDLNGEYPKNILSEVANQRDPPKIYTKLLSCDRKIARILIVFKFNPYIKITELEKTNVINNIYNKNFNSREEKILNGISYLERRIETEKNKETLSLLRKAEEKMNKIYIRTKS